MSDEELTKTRHKLEMMFFIDHPAIVKIHAVAEDTKFVYVIMELIKSVNVSAQLAC
jgi:hypothetical protein